MREVDVASRSTGRSTRPFRRARAQVLSDSDICCICGHPGSDSVDHTIPRSVSLELAEDADNLRPAHHEPCPTCGQRCNRVRGTRPLSEVVRLETSRDWFAQSVQEGRRG